MNDKQLNELASVGQFVIYTKDYNGLIDLIQLNPDNLYEKMLIFINNQPPILYDSYMRSVFSSIIKNKKILPTEKIKYISIFQDKVPYTQFIDALFLVDFSGNSLFSLVFEANSISLINSVLRYLKKLTKYNYEQLLNYHDKISDRDKENLSSDLLKTVNLKDKVIIFPKLEFQKAAKPKSLFEIAIELKSKKLTSFLIYKGYNKESISRSSFSLTQRTLLTKNLQIFRFVDKLNALNPSEFLLYSDLCFFIDEGYLNATCNYIQNNLNTLDEKDIMKRLLFGTYEKKGILVKIINLDDDKLFAELM